MDESNFKLIFVFLLIGINLIRFYYHYKSKTQEKLHHKKFKEVSSVILFYIMFAIPSILYLTTNYLDFFNLDFYLFIRYFGIVLVIISALIFIWTHQTLGKNFSSILTIKKDHKLIIEGPYKYVRHPMYTSIFLMILGFFFLTSNILVGILPFLSFCYLYFSRVKNEEKMLTEIFKKDYIKYSSITGRLIPKLWN